jgi:hypothetical protein
VMLCSRAGDAMAKPRIMGIALGLCLATAVIGILDWCGHRTCESSGPLLPDCDGALQGLVVHYVPEAGSVVERAYREFLRQLPRDVVVHVVCPEQADYEDLTTHLGPLECRLSPVLTHHAMTSWSRDRWLALHPAAKRKPTVILLPRRETGAEAWPARAGDMQTGEDLAAASDQRVRAQRSELLFDGGDFVADSETAFVIPNLLRRNLQHTVRNREELVARLGEILKRRVVLLDDAPEHHAGMYMMTAGNRTVIVGDPMLAKGLLDENGGEPVEALVATGGGADFNTECKRRFDAVAQRCAAEGYRVVRIPVVPGKDSRTYLTYVNAILDERDGKRTVYMPVYRGAEKLNAAGEAVWRSLGYEVRTVDCTEVFPHFGSLHCLVNVLRRT